MPSLRTEPHNHAGEGDERIRTAETGPRYERPDRLLECPANPLVCAFCGKCTYALIANPPWNDLECAECAAIPLPQPRRPTVREERPVREGYVYFVQAESGPVKIGFAVNVGKRLEALQTGSHERLELVHARRSTFSEERALHRKYALLRERGEWFRPAVLELEGLDPRGSWERWETAA